VTLTLNHDPNASPITKPFTNANPKYMKKKGSRQGESLPEKQWHTRHEA